MKTHQSINYTSYALFISGIISMGLAFFSKSMGQGVFPIILAVTVFVMNRRFSLANKKGHLIILLTIGLICFLYITMFYALIQNQVEWGIKLFIHMILTALLVFTTVKLLNSYIYKYYKKE